MDRKPDDIVLNIGWHIGSFDIYAFDKVKSIVTYEPYKENFDKLCRHLKENNIKNVLAFNVAVARDDGKVTLTIGSNGGHNTTLPMEWNNQREVEADGIETIFRLEPFTKIKCDCEWGEVDIFDGVTIPETVKEMIFETHEEIAGIEKTTRMISQFQDQWFDCKLIKNDESDRTHLLHCKR